MIKDLVVQVSERTETGKNASRRYRRSGQVPGVVYGLDRPPVHILVDPKKIDEVLRLETGRNTIFTLSLGQDRNRAVLIRDLQRDPVTERALHIDFARVDLDRTVKIQVPIRVVGVPEGVKTEGGILEHILRTVEVECLPKDIPEHLDVEASGLHINQHLSVGDIPANERIKILTDADATILVVAPPREEEVAAPVEAAAEPTAAEPEVIKKGKEAAPAEEPPAK
jgi:large subunit ribosomal protein L25